MRTSTWLHGIESGGPISSPASLHTCFNSTTPTAHSISARTISAHMGSILQMRNFGSINSPASNRTGRVRSDSASQPPAFGPMVINGSTYQLSARLGSALAVVFDRTGQHPATPSGAVGQVSARSSRISRDQNQQLSRLDRLDNSTIHPASCQPVGSLQAICGDFRRPDWQLGNQTNWRNLAVTSRDTSSPMHTPTSTHRHAPVPARETPCSPSETTTLPRARTANDHEDSPRLIKTHQDSPRLAKTRKDIM